MGCLKARSRDNGDRLLQELGQYQSVPCWAQRTERTRVLSDQNKILVKKLDNEAVCSFHSPP